MIASKIIIYTLIVIYIFFTICVYKEFYNK